MQQRMVDAEGTYVFGTKPVWSDEEVHIEDSRVYKAINWYSYKYDKSNVKDILIEYFLEVEQSEYYAKQIKSYDESRIKSSVAWICDMILNGLILIDPESKFLDKIEDLKNNPKKFSKVQEEVVEKEDKPKKTSPMMRVKMFSSKIISEIDQEIDDFVMNNCQTDFNIKKYSKTIKPIYGKMISENYKSLLTELEIAVNREDKDVEESYSFMKRSELKKYLKFVKEIVDVFGTLKMKRKKRKKSKTKKTEYKAKNLRKPKKQADKQIKAVSITDFM